MSDLTTLRNHARLQAAWTPSERSQWCVTFFGLPVDHERCDGKLGASGITCACDCHPIKPGPTESERKLWTQIADEIDTYLAKPDEPGLFGDAP